MVIDDFRRARRGREDFFGPNALTAGSTRCPRVMIRQAQEGVRARIEGAPSIRQAHTLTCEIGGCPMGLYDLIQV